MGADQCLRESYRAGHLIVPEPLCEHVTHSICFFQCQSCMAEFLGIYSKKSWALIRLAIYVLIYVRCLYLCQLFLHVCFGFFFVSTEYISLT